MTVKMHEHAACRAGLDERGVPVWRCACGWSGNWWAYMDHVGQVARDQRAARLP